ncbi:MAG: biotin transporter BioY [Verrucomicrobiota bacterium]|nr:biotin transporter BioY [Verrucomicrobiota bacterium]
MNTLFQTLSSQTFSSSRVNPVLLTLLAAALISLSGPLSISLPFTPVPLSLRPHLVLLIAALLGSRQSMTAVSLFLVQAALGLPVLVGGASLFGPTGGYCIGYLVAAALVGTLVERLKNQTPLRLFAILALGSSAILFLGMCHLALFIGWEKAFLCGVAPFLPGDLLKLLLVTCTVQAARRRFAS